MRWRVLSVIGRISGGFLIGLVITAGLPVPIAAQSVAKPRIQPGAAVKIQGPRLIPKPKDQEAAAVLMNLIARYASNVTDKTELDKRFEQSLSTDQGGRQAARRMIANLQRAPLVERRTVFGKWADTAATAKFSPADVRRTFGRLSSLRPLIASPEEPAVQAKPGSQLKHKRFESPNDERPDARPGSDERRPFREWIPRDRDWIPGPGAQQRFFFPKVLPVAWAQPRVDHYQLYYNGMWCRYETDEDHLTDSDEIYAIVTITEANGTTKTVSIPSRHDPPYYWDVDDGEYRPKSGNIRLIWGGAQGKTARDVAVTVWVWEQDSGDPEERRQAIDLTWKAAAAICAATVENTVVPCVIAILGAAAIEGIVAIVSGGDDDLVGEGSVTAQVSADQMRRWVNSGLRTFRRGDLPCHFRTIHIGKGNSEGADYRMYFAFHIPLDAY